MEKVKGLTKKRFYLINRDFQLRYTWAAILVGLISTLLTSFLILYPLFVFEILKIPRFLPTPILMAMFAAALLNMILVGCMGILLTHRIAGPMYSMVRTMHEVEQGDWSGSMRIREMDDLGYLVRNFNGMLDSIRQGIEGDLELVKKIKESLGPSEQDSFLSDLEQRLEQRLSKADKP